MERKFHSNFRTAVFFFAFVTAFSLYLTHLSLRGRYYQAELEKLAKGRTPAAIRKDMDLSELDGAALVSASQKRLLSAARVILQDSEIGIELGHFVTRDLAGNKELACDFYSKVILRFEADGIAEFDSSDNFDGERFHKPRMEIEGPCRTADDITRIEPIWIPVDKILDERPGDIELSYGGDVHFKFDSMTSEWPRRWILTSIRLFNESEPGRDINISSTEIREIREKKAFVLNFK